MGGFYKPYPNEFYALNDLLPEHFLKNQPHLINTIDFTNRCFNYNAIHPAMKQFSDEIYSNVINYLKDNKDLVLRYINQFFPGPQRERFRNVVETFSLKNPWSPASDDRKELHYHLVDLYHSFPNHPERHLDGILRKIEDRLARSGQRKRFRYATIDLLLSEACHGKLPCAKMQFFGYEDNEVMQIPLDKPGAFSEEIIANQEDLTIAKECQHRITEPVKTGPQKRHLADQPEDPSDVFFSYLSPLFFDPNFDGSKKREGVTEFPFWSFIVFPIYSAELAAAGCFGTVIGHLYLSFTNEAERIVYLESKGGRPDPSWDTLNIQILRTLLEGRSHSALEEDSKSFDIIQRLLANIGHIQDWERVFVFADPLEQEPLYCFKRFPGNEKNLTGYAQVWSICEKENDCKVCIKDIRKRIYKAVCSIDREHGSSLRVLGRAFCEDEMCFFVQPLKEILEPRILPSIEAGDIDRYRQYILVFEFPTHTFYPPDIQKKDAVEKLGEHYLKRLIPIFDRSLMKRKVLKHSVKSAVAAIVSRNHSHHIGSHVTPRVGLEKVITRLHQLGYQHTEFERKAQIAGALKSRLDQYIQKKADFLSEIVTEPLTTTKTLGFFNGVILPFIQNTPLMDNIGANEGVHYKKGLWDDSRLRIHVCFENRELKATLWGGDPCTCNQETQTTNYPYSGQCQCSNPYPMQIKEPELDDASVALPGPLGEFAVYAFLENFIRNAVKHNQETFRKEPDLYLDVYIRISELPESDPERNDFYRIEVWESLTRPGEELIARLKDYIEEPVVDRYGQIRKGSWGIAEMKIMATLLRGSDDFFNMGSSLHVHGEDKLVYEFRVMKPREIALISKEYALHGRHNREGIRWFHSLEDFIRWQKLATSPAVFNFVILDRNIGESREDFTHLLPNRVFMHDALHVLITGSVKIDDRFMESIQKMSPDVLMSLVWRHWIRNLPGLSEKEKAARVALFLGQTEDEVPTNDWLNLARKLNEGGSQPGLSVIFLGEECNEICPPVKAGERLAVFDRHFGGYDALPENALIDFHEAFDKNSADFIPIFSSRPSDTLVCQMTESALLQVLILDERIAEVAYERILQTEGSNNSQTPSQRIEVCRRANIYLATHLQIDDDAVKTLHHDIGDDLPQVLVQMTTGSLEERRISTFNVSWISRGENGILKRKKIEPQIVILHQGILETFFRKKILREKGESFMGALKGFIDSLRGFIPFVIVDSGRGIPVNLPPDVKFMPFSLIQEYIMQENIAKHSLTKILMALIRRGNQ